MDVQMIKGTDRKSLVVNLPKQKVNPWTMLYRNFGSVIRNGMTLGGEGFLGVDLPLEQDEGSVLPYRNLLCEVAQDFYDGKDFSKMVRFKPADKADLDQWNIPLGINLDMNVQSVLTTLAVRGERFELYSAGQGSIVCVQRLPLMLFGDSGMRAPENGLENVPAYYACFVNTRLHFGQIFHCEELGWGCCLQLQISAIPEVQRIFLDRFSALCTRVKLEAWKNIKALYGLRLAQEYMSRNASQF